MLAFRDLYSSFWSPLPVGDNMVREVERFEMGYPHSALNFAGQVHGLGPCGYKSPVKEVSS